MELNKKKQQEHTVSKTIHSKEFRRLSNSVGERINEFDSWETQIVGNFNAQFPECPLTGYDVEDPVLIGAPAPNNSRELLVDGVLVIHKMYSDLLYGLDKGEFHMVEEELDEMYGHPI